jgi:sterol desaturase/sphingolipid hydroxylase (fatty acid hydroxylase superfamily)
MPTPIEVLLDPISLLVIALYATLMLWEALFPARQLPVSRAWRFRGMSAFVIFFYLSTYLPLYWDSYLLQYQLFDLSGLGTVYGALAGLLVYEFAVYVWHRSMHAFDPLWKVFHQMHHSAERLDTYGAFYFSPMDMLGWSFLGSLCLTLLVGLEAQAVTKVTACIMVKAFMRKTIPTCRCLICCLARL